MIDGVKIFIPPQSVSEKLIRVVDFPVHISDSTGEILQEDVRERKIDGLWFRLLPTGAVLINGSIHKFLNEGRHNYDDFDKVRLNSALSRLEEMFGIDLAKAQLQNIEIGLNLTCPFPTTSFLDSIINYKGKSLNREMKYGKDYLVCKMSECHLKIYNKALQYNRDGQILRFEIKVIKTREIERIGVGYLIDLRDEEKLKKALNYFVRFAHGLLINDPSISVEELPEDKQKTYMQGSNPEYWNCLRKSESAQNIHKRRKIFRELVNEYGDSNYHDLLVKVLHEKIESYGLG